jgi:hypothetical protein
MEASKQPNVPKHPKAVIEIAVFCNDIQLRRLQGFLKKVLHVTFFVEPDREYDSLDELREECQEKEEETHA